jgi:type II secretory pathway component PulF
MQEFFENAGRYPRFLVTITLGIFFFLFEKLRPLLKNPVSAVALITFTVAAFMFVTFTLRAMLGLSTV